MEEIRKVKEENARLLVENASLQARIIILTKVIERQYDLLSAMTAGHLGVSGARALNQAAGAAVRE